MNKQSQTYIYKCVNTYIYICYSFVHTYMYIYIYIYTYISSNRSACRKVPHVALVRWIGFDDGVCGCFTGALQIRVTKGEVSIVNRFKKDPTRCPKRPTWSQKGIKVSQGTSQNISWGTESNKRGKSFSLGAICDQNL